MGIFHANSVNGKQKAFCKNIQYDCTRVIAHFLVSFHSFWQLKATMVLSYRDGPLGDSDAAETLS